MQDGLDWEAAFGRAYGAAHAVLRDAARAEEVAQEACLKALVKLGSFAGTGSFPSWVGAIAFRLALDAKKSLGPGGPDPDGLASPDDPEASASSREQSEALHECLSRLSDRQRTILLDKYHLGMKGAEIAADVGVREGTVWATLSQATANLRRCLEGHGIGREALH